MATTPATQPAPGNLTLKQWIEFAQANNINDEMIDRFLCPPLPPNSVSRWLSRIGKIENAAKPPGISGKEWSGKKSRLKGRAFESMVRLILKSIPSFTIWKNVTTTTNEIDLLVKIGSTIQVSPVIRQWGPHFLCECKLVNKSINATWIGKLNSVLELHAAEVGMLLSSQGPPRGKVKTQIHMHAFKVPPRVIVCISLDELKECENGKNVLSLVTTRYIEAKTGAAALIAQ